MDRLKFLITNCFVLALLTATGCEYWHKSVRDGGWSGLLIIGVLMVPAVLYTIKKLGRKRAHLRQNPKDLHRGELPQK